MNLRIAVAVAMAIAALITATAAAQVSSPGDVLKTKHNVGTPGGNPACGVCHTPHDAKGSYLWPTDVRAGGGLEPLCYSCHDGSVTSKGAVAFNPTKEQHPVKRGVSGEDCDSCHDSHANTYAFTTLTDLGANSCLSCHGKAGSMNHPIDKVSDAAPPLDRIFVPNAGDFSGTRLYDAAGSKVLTSGQGYVKCLSCHTAHGAITNRLTTMPLWTTSDASSPLCQNCHR